MIPDNKYNFYSKMLTHVINDRLKIKNLIKRPIEVNFEDTLELLKNSTVDYDLNIFCYDETELRIAYELNVEFVKNGKKYIKISNKVAEFLATISLENIDLKYIKQPFNAMAWLMPKELSGSKKDHIIYSRFTDDNCFDYGTFSQVKNNSPYAARMDRKIIITKNKFDQKNKWPPITPSADSDMIKTFKTIYKACLFIEAYPECLKIGSDFEENYFIYKDSNKKLMKDKLPSFELILPKKFSNLKNAHYTKRHLRVLKNKRFRRLDENGNLLPIGEPGRFQMIIIEGHFKGGQLYHVVKNNPN